MVPWIVLTCILTIVFVSIAFIAQGHTWLIVPLLLFIMAIMLWGMLNPNDDWDNR